MRRNKNKSKTTLKPKKKKKGQEVDPPANNRCRTKTVKERNPRKGRLSECFTLYIYIYIKKPSKTR